jgi:hypothetical protein
MNKPMDVERTLRELVESFEHSLADAEAGRLNMVSKDFYAGQVSGARAAREAVREALREPGALSQPTELLIRMFLWEGHGHNDQLYGDDGEMQCGVCRVDYKRDSLDVLVEHARVAALETGLKKLSSKQEPPAPAVTLTPCPVCKEHHSIMSRCRIQEDIQSPAPPVEGKQEPGAEAAPPVKESFIEWALCVLFEQGLSGWEIKPGEPYCWTEQKTIAFEGEDRVLFLHEVAHALVPEAEGPLRNHYHGGMWASKFAELIRRYFIFAADAPPRTAAGESTEPLRAALKRIIEVRNERDKVLMIAEAALAASQERSATEEK